MSVSRPASLGVIAALLLALAAGLAVRSIAPASVAAGITPSCIVGTQLVRNGSFEEDDFANNQFNFQPTGWSGTGILVVNTPLAPDGDQYFGPPGSGGTLSQVITTTGLDGATLTVSYFAAQYDTQVSVSVNGDSQSPVSNGAVFVPFSYETVLSDPAPPSVTLELRAEGAGPYFDAVSITVADCPAEPTATPTVMGPSRPTATLRATPRPRTNPTSTTVPSEPTVRATERPRTNPTATTVPSEPTVRPTARPRTTPTSEPSVG